MTVYAIAQFTITDLAAYRRYQSRFADVFQVFDGTLLAADESPTVEEGSWPHQKVVLLAFPDEAALRAGVDCCGDGVLGSASQASRGLPSTSYR